MIAAMFEKWFRKASKRLYLDYAAATPLLPAVREMTEGLSSVMYGNPSAIHQEGADARNIVEDARHMVARTLGVRPVEVFFTASGTESNNLAIAGVIEAKRGQGTEYRDMTVLTTALEHPSVSAVLQLYAKRGVSVVHMPIDETGQIVMRDCADLLTEQVVLVTTAYANSEIGVVQPISRMGRMIRKYNTEHQTNIVFHVDAAQAPLWLPCQLHTLKVDILSLDAGKCHGPKGVGVLVKRNDVMIEPLVLGGGQESGLRAGTENTFGIMGAAIALKDADAERDRRVAAAHRLSVALWNELQTMVPTAVWNGPVLPTSLDSSSLQRLPHNVHISVPGLDTEYATIYLDQQGIACSTKSACSGAGGGESAVIAAISGDSARSAATLRFTIDPQLSVDDMKRVARALADCVALQQTIDAPTK